jgi:formamidopyrimidine-DNA glycosylase
MGLTSAQRYNKRMDDIWEKAKATGVFDDKKKKKPKKCIKCGKPITDLTSTETSSKWCDACYYFD